MDTLILDFLKSQGIVSPSLYFVDRISRVNIIKQLCQITNMMTIKLDIDV